MTGETRSPDNLHDDQIEGCQEQSQWHGSNSVILTAYKYNESNVKLDI